jgi:serine phosphatase RsbU (regulator of sigma subunit)
METERIRESTRSRLKKVLYQKLEHREKLVSQRYTEVTSSINYARHIQEVILPKQSFLFDNFTEHILIYQPKDIVSGDFYWFNKLGDKTYIVVGDCTGHGVPGGFMSMIGHMLLHFSINERRIEDPGQILSMLHRDLRSHLKQYDDSYELTDGIDLSICVIDRIDGIIQFAGANRPLILLTNDGDNKAVNEIKGDKYGVGGKVLGKERTYSTHHIPYEAGTRLFMFTDGYQDQFGGSNDKKIGSKTTKELIALTSLSSMRGQQDLLKRYFNDWKGRNEQTDDVLMIGIEL